MNEIADLDELFEDGNTLKEEMSDEEVTDYVEEIKKKRKEGSANYGRDGSVEVFSKKFEYRDMPFRIIVRRYFRISPMDINAEMSDGTDKWAELKPVGESDEIAAFLSKYDLKFGFLNHHTTHSWNEDMDLKERFEECVEEAKDDIDWFRDKAEDKVEERISEMQSWFDDVNSNED